MSNDRADIAAAAAEAADVLVYEGQTIRGWLELGGTTLNDGAGGARTLATTFGAPGGTLTTLRQDDMVQVNGEMYRVVRSAEYVGTMGLEVIELAGPYAS